MIERDNIGTCKYEEECVNPAPFCVACQFEEECTCKHKGKTGFSRYISSCSCNKEKKARNNRFLMQIK